MLDNNWSDMTPKYIPEDRILSDEEYNKLRFHLTTQVNAILQIFNCYGLGECIPMVAEKIVELSENFGQAVRGDKHKPIHVIDKPLRRPTE